MMDIQIAVALHKKTGERKGGFYGEGRRL